MHGCLSPATYWGPGPQPRHVPGNRTGNPLVCRPALNPLSYTSQGQSFNLQFCTSQVEDLGTPKDGSCFSCEGH